MKKKKMPVFSQKKVLFDERKIEESFEKYPSYRILGKYFYEING